MVKIMSIHKLIVLYVIMAMYTITKIKFVKNNLINNVYTIMMNQISLHALVIKRELIMII